METTSLVGRALALAMACFAAAAFARGAAPAAAQEDPGARLPQRLQDTGLQAAEALAFSPQYPLWSDGAAKQRWFRLPAGAAIDGSRPDAWRFPAGTRLWKTFSHDGRAVETRYMELARDGRWRFGTYVWNEAGTDAVLAPLEGIAGLPVAGAPGGRYTVPSRADCLACHGSAPVPVLGLSALQLSTDRDPLAPGAAPARAGELDLRALVRQGLLRGLPASLQQSPPRVAGATAVERAALGYLHANCGHCHNGSANRVPLRLTLAQRAADPSSARQEVLRSAVEAATRWRAPGAEDLPVIAPGRPDGSALLQRMRSRHRQTQMPPLGTRQQDDEGLALVARWITHDLTRRKEDPK